MAPWRSRLVAALLAGVLLMTGVLALQGWSAGRERRAVAEGALRDYAAFAATEFGRRSRDGLTQAGLFGALRPALTVDGTLGPGRFPHPIVLSAPPARAPEVDLRATGAARSWFRIEAVGPTVAAAGDSLSAAARAWLADSVLAQARQLHRGGRYFGLLVGAPDGEPVVAAFASRYDERLAVSVVYGMLGPVTGLAPVFAHVMAGTPLLPRAREVVPNDEALALEVRTASGAAVYQRGPPPGPAAVTETLGLQFGGLVARVATRPDAADRLVIGGMDRHGTWTLAGTFGLAVLLVGVALAQWRREAALARLREDFVAGVSHELRTPLAQIRLFAETLLLGRLRSEDERQRALAVVHDESRRLSHLVENLLQFSRAGAGGRDLAPEPLDAGALARAVAEGFAPLAAHRGVTVTVAEAEGRAVADRDALRQVLLNLLDNAVRHGAADRPVVLRVMAGGAVCRFTVDDAGPGIAPADRARIFERYTRLPGARGTTGAGLGLAVVRELVERMRGTVRVEDAPGMGSGARFVVELPVPEAER